MALSKIIQVKQTITTGSDKTVLGGMRMSPDTWYDILDEAGRTSLFNDNRVKEGIFKDPQDVYISNGIINLPNQLAYDWISHKDQKDLDGRNLVHDTPRYLGTYTYFTSTDDDHTDPHAVGGDNVCELMWNHTSGSDLTKTIYLDYNTINNTTYVRQGDMQWENAHHDSVSFTIVPKITDYTVSSNTDYDLYGGYLVIPNPYGTGTISIETSSAKLVQLTPNEFGNYPAGYWDATWDSTNKEFTDIQPNYYGTGEYNIFTYEVELYKFMNKRLLMGTHNKDCMTEDSSQIGHNMRLRVDLETRLPDHNWSWNGNVMLYRQRTI